MSRINRISNTSPLIESKVNYFLDRFHYYLDFVGSTYELELDNPLSLTEKLQFQLKHGGSRLEYVDNYLSNDFFDEGGMLKDYIPFWKCSDVIKKYRALSKNQRNEKASIVDSVRFQNSINNLQKDLQHKMTKEVVQGLYSVIVCPHSVMEMDHDKMLDQQAKILVSEYLFQGWSKGDIRKLCNNIFGKEIHSFPFPIQIRTESQKRKHLLRSD